ncbi:galectin 17 isoform X2 [Kryptolebias marmoratus]|uniref:galectin 17 isoform X2 n=1 Tax=Kryptolebias marmoratus TaxID=37003 RepID=UPI0018ACB98F|nr:galectin 17 isoform X2 [Kryptolebias marmoratus]
MYPTNYTLKISTNCSIYLYLMWCFSPCVFVIYFLFRLFILLQCFLAGCLVDDSALPSGALPLSIMSTVGSQAVLPCSWKSSQAGAGPSDCHVQWVSTPVTVFERHGEDRWQAEEYRGRLEVPQEKLGSGDCSLIINDVQIEDTGRYESFVVVDDARSKKVRVPVQSVKLIVTDNKSWDSRHPGEDFVLELRTRRSFTVVFQRRNSSEWLDLWERGDKNSERLEKHPLLEQLTVKKLMSSDEGTYKVLDENGYAVSTVQLSVTDDAAKSSCSALLIICVCVLSFQTLGFH